MKKILVVDDDPYILMSLEFLMKKEGFDVKVARNGTEALDIIQQETPALVLLDIMMPDMDGYAICKHIKGNKKLQHIKVVFLSAKSKESDIQKGYDLGASLYVTKPFSTRDLMKKVRELLAAA
ncbi:MAG TPA: response regulator [Chitinophagaceae bacterium]|nr:response regulator [Chitinophagaceae bacterium]HCY89533.1 response regulator [Chitinophagaceae bacterium]HRF26075.1 response regulator [Ferruginibacter sp.]